MQILIVLALLFKRKQRTIQVKHYSFSVYYKLVKNYLSKPFQLWLFMQKIVWYNAGLSSYVVTKTAKI